MQPPVPPPMPSASPQFLPPPLSAPQQLPVSGPGVPGGAVQPPPVRRRSSFGLWATVAGGVVAGIVILGLVIFFALDGFGPSAGDRRVVRLGNAQLPLRWCPAGEFEMGSPTWEEDHNSDETQHHVTLSQGFWMGETELTQAVWKEVMGSNPSRETGDDRPVETVSWNEAHRFLEKLNSRPEVQRAGLRFALPSEAQWEYACRAGSTGPFAGTGDVHEMGWAGDEDDIPHSVGEKTPNAWGLLDMHGNVWEMCEDRYGDYPEESVVDPTGPRRGPSRVIRGGCAFVATEKARSSYRFFVDDDSSGNGLGLRVVALKAD